MKLIFELNRTNKMKHVFTLTATHGKHTSTAPFSSYAKAKACADGIAMSYGMTANSREPYRRGMDEQYVQGWYAAMQDRSLVIERHSVNSNSARGIAYVFAKQTEE